MRLCRLFVLLGAAVFSMSAAQASSLPTVSSIFLSGGLIVQAGFKCGMVDGKLVCGKTQGGDDNKKSDDDHGKHSKGKGSGLGECTIQQPGSGGGCKTGFKWVCEKLKSGKKCCGCVTDPNPKPNPNPNPKPAETPNPAAERVCCTANHPSGDPQKFCGLLNDARKNAGAARFNGEPPANIFCTPE